MVYEQDIYIFFVLYTFWGKMNKKVIEKIQDEDLFMDSAVNNLETSSLFDKKHKSRTITPEELWYLIGFERSI